MSHPCIDAVVYLRVFASQDFCTRFHHVFGKRVLLAIKNQSILVFNQMLLISSALFLQSVDPLILELKAEVIRKDLNFVFLLHMIIIPLRCLQVVFYAVLELIHIVIKLFDGVADAFKAYHHVSFLAKSLLVTLLVN